MAHLVFGFLVLVSFVSLRRAVLEAIAVVAGLDDVAVMATKDGKFVTLQELGHGELFGELSAIDSKGRSTSVWTTEETSVIRISGPNFKDMIARMPSLSELTMLRLCDLSRFLCEKVVNGMTCTIPEQIRIEIANILLAQPEKNGALTIDNAPTHEEIAQRVGTNREQVTRAMAPYKNAELITQSGKTWHVPDVNAALEALLKGL